MTELQRGHVAILDREESSPTQSTEPELEPVAREIGIGSGTEDSSITVIENPLLVGYTGLILARRFHQRFQWRDLIDVQHVRADDKNNVNESKHYLRVRIDKGFGHVLYNFVATDTGLILPAPNILPYEICFIPPSDYEHFHDGLRRGRNEKDVVEAMYRLLGQKVPTFSLENERLVLPRDYASLKL